MATESNPFQPLIECARDELDVDTARLVECTKARRESPEAPLVHARYLVAQTTYDLVRCKLASFEAQGQLHEVQRKFNEAQKLLLEAEGLPSTSATAKRVKAKVEKAKLELKEAEAKVKEAKLELKEAKLELKEAEAKVEAALPRGNAAAGPASQGPVTADRVPRIVGLPGRAHDGPVPTGTVTWVAASELMVVPLLLGHVIALDGRGNVLTTEELCGKLYAEGPKCPVYIALSCAALMSNKLTSLVKDLADSVEPLVFPAETRPYGFHGSYAGMRSHERMFTAEAAPVLAKAFEALKGSEYGYRTGGSARDAAGATGGPASAASLSNSTLATPQKSVSAARGGERSQSSTAHDETDEGVGPSAPFMNVMREFPVYAGDMADEGVKATYTVDVLFCMQSRAHRLPVGIWELGRLDSPQRPFEHKSKQTYAYAHNCLAASSGLPLLGPSIGLRSTFPSGGDTKDTVPVWLGVDGFVLPQDQLVSMHDHTTVLEENMLQRVELVPVLHAAALVRPPPEILEPHRQHVWCYMYQVARFAIASAALAASAHRRLVDAEVRERPVVVSRIVTILCGLVFKSFDRPIGSLLEPSASYKPLRRRINEALWSEYSAELFVAALYSTWSVAKVDSLAASVVCPGRGSRQSAPLREFIDDLRAKAEAGGGVHRCPWGLITKFVRSEPPRVAHFVTLLDTLARMLDQGHAHADIRESNIVFGENSAAWFIDWDFGGSLNGEPALTYPPRFNPSIDDGARAPDARAEAPVMPGHDVFALGAVMARMDGGPGWNEMVGELKRAVANPSPAALAAVCRAVADRLRQLPADNVGVHTALPYVAGQSAVMRPAAAGMQADTPIVQTGSPVTSPVTSPARA